MNTKAIIAFSLASCGIAMAQETTKGRIYIGAAKDAPAWVWKVPKASADTNQLAANASWAKWVDSAWAQQRADAQQAMLRDEAAHAQYVADQVEPYFTTNATTEADNTARYVRDRDSSTLTPLDQGNSKADLDTTAQIRKEILDGKNMSVNARNVKIITMDGHVTLRGPVNNAEEKRLIGEIADRIAHSENVDNQLEVKFTISSND
jgi:hypothetical protein